jgi:hypothetical protein
MAYQTTNLQEASFLEGKYAHDRLRAYNILRGLTLDSKAAHA